MADPANRRRKASIGKVEEYREKLRTLDDWDAYLLQESRLPGPRASLELAFAVAAQPALGKPRMEQWITSQDPDIRWIMKQNLKKKRLLRMDEAWVQAQLQLLDQ